MRRNAFTLTELVIVLAMLGVLGPAIYHSWRAAENGVHEAAATFDAAAATRSLSEELRRDLLTLSWRNEQDLTLSGRGPCGEVRYELSAGVVHRRATDACGGDRAVAAHVESLVRTPWGVDVVFARHVRHLRPPTRTLVRIGAGSGG